ncbi:MAG: Rieske (2Fe-2S) protein [Acidobacteria bacterium]|nr:Rieske (2Fe-2S) protein [Acidobacteriota bacterium]MCW5947953.1 Rieske (2Fe-2S) protein [Pyrinomonadaceae bacterium]
MINESTIKEIISSQGEDEPEGEDMSRRSFLWMGAGAIGAVYIGAIGYPVYRYLATPAERAAQAAAVTQTTLDGADKLPVNTALMFKFGTKPAMLIRHADGTFSAFNAVCTHLGCTVAYDTAAAKITCACHGGEYDPTSGSNLAGPPPKPLTRFNVEVQDGRVTVARA